ncbi:MAG: 2-hydroxychromene-2-carboxylate isomerase [Gammaproteobacteria bacterium]|nr:2-hydroxychromene-2-carboxylate isomerase [Gammaproteobacteria bacterium]
MSIPVEFYFDYVGPYAYLANTQLPKLGLDVIHKPISILDVMKKVGNQPSPKCPPKLAHAMADTARLAKRHGVPLAPNAEIFAGLQSGEADLHFFARAALAAQKLGEFVPFHAATFDAFWGHPKSIITADAFAAVLNAAGVSGDTIVALARQRETEDSLDQANDAAVAAGVFGVPFFRVGENVFFGSDRLDFVKEYALEGAQ